MQITIDNYKEFKPSELIRLFASYVEQTGNIPMDMAVYVVTCDSKYLPCLGGLVCMNLKTNNWDMFRLGNSIRMGCGTRTISKILGLLYGARIPELNSNIIDTRRTLKFFGYVKTTRKKAMLIKQINLYANAYAKINY